MTRHALIILLWATACGGTTLQTLDDLPSPNGGSSAAGVSVRPTGGGGASGRSNGGSTALGGEPASVPASGGALADGAAAGAAGESAASGSGPVGEGGAPAGPACLSSADCPPTSSPCTYARCDAGECVTENTALGTLVERDLPADCHDTVCDGQGATVAVVDTDNAPQSTDACQLLSCSSNGEVSSAPSASGAACAGAGGAKFCDGAGQCVACLAKGDCQVGESCVDHQCLPDSCQDGFKDQLETDVDCGGPCAPCAAFKDCAKDADCASKACDAYAPHRCLADHCKDHHTSVDESDVDCGGSCAKCEAGFCNTDSDCLSNVCVKERGSICLAQQCVDGVQDGNETDFDCGGGICNGCANGQKCYASWDCASRACNALTLLCQADHCTDHAWDGDEVDLDCGGSSCARCALGKRCLQTSDCQDGLHCDVGYPHVCL